MDVKTQLLQIVVDLIEVWQKISFHAFYSNFTHFLNWQGHKLSFDIELYCQNLLHLMLLFVDCYKSNFEVFGKPQMVLWLDYFEIIFC